MRQEALDLIIEGGWVIDGLGGPRRRADGGVAGERRARGVAGKPDAAAGRG